MDKRPLTDGETTLCRTVFGDAIDYSRVRLVKRKWWPLQPPNTIMTPCGNLHFHPGGSAWSDDFSKESISLQGLFIHEMTHVWQSQKRGRFYLPLMRHPFCRYDYAVRTGWPLERYGLEQQAEIVSHAFLLRHGVGVPGMPPRAQLETSLPFRPGYSAVFATATRAGRSRRSFIM
jgi:hypothetical protein